MMLLIEKEAKIISKSELERNISSDQIKKPKHIYKFSFIGYDRSVLMYKEVTRYDIAMSCKFGSRTTIKHKRTI